MPSAFGPSDDLGHLIIIFLLSTLMLRNTNALATIKSTEST